MSQGAWDDHAVLLTGDDLRAARDVLTQFDAVRYTPVEHSRAFSERLGGDVFLKCENLQRTGSFKLRGAFVRIARLSPQERSRGVVAASAGNHAQGVALASSLLGAAATVFMPVTASLPKLAATKGYGAEVRLVGSTVDEALTAAHDHARTTGAILIHPFDHRDVIAGQGTVGLEIAEQCPQARTVLVCTGGGGLLAGTAVAVRESLPQARVYGVQAAGAAAWPPSLAAGRPVPTDTRQTLADGIAVGCPGDLPFAHVQALVEDVVTVSDEDISRALLMLLERSKLLVEPAGAAAAAAVLAGSRGWEPPVVVTLSGGNIDPLVLTRVLQHGLAVAQRYLRFVVRVPDQPGTLATLLRRLAEQHVNVLEIEHRRSHEQLRLNEAAVSLTVEARGPEHATAVLTALRETGYVVVRE